MSWLSDYALSFIDRMTAGEEAILMSLLAIVAAALIVLGMSSNRRRRNFASRDAHFRHLQDI
jgi:putative exporter of polyketide antibiotics